jgi:hypothetical protein
VKNAGSRDAVRRKLCDDDDVAARSLR